MTRLPQSWVALDFETADGFGVDESGRRVQPSHACAVGLVYVLCGRIIGLWSRLVRPECAFDPGAVAIHGITEARVENAPTFATLWPSIAATWEAVGVEAIVAHNAPFDRSVLEAEVARNPGLTMPSLPWICSLDLAREAWPQLPRHRLSSVCEALDIGLRHHDAGSDSRASAIVALAADFALENASTPAGRLITGRAFCAGIRACEGES